MVHRKVIAIVVMALAFWTSAAHAELIVIVHESNTVTTLSSDKLANYFKRNSRFWENGTKVDPVDLIDNHPLATEFSEAVLGMPLSMKQSMWTIRTLSGAATPPPQLQNEAAVIEYIASHAGAVGYISSRPRDSRVRVIEISDLK